MGTGSLLETVGLRKHFGGVRAVDGVDLQVREGELLAIIGPNGAGKTTLFDLLTGRLRADSGRVVFAGLEITRLATSEIVRLGIGRSFQLINIFSDLSVYENALVAVLSHMGWSARALAPLGRARQAHAQAEALLQRSGLEEVASLPARSLSRGHQKRLEMALALAVEPRLLLLDEPTAGMAPGEIEEITGLLTGLARGDRRTLVFTEHDMNVVFSVASRILVMHQGKIIAEGTPEEVRANPEVQGAYLGNPNWQSGRNVLNSL